MVKHEVGITFGEKSSYVYVSPPLSSDEAILLVNRGAIDFDWLLQSGDADPRESLIRVPPTNPNENTNELILQVGVRVTMVLRTVREMVFFKDGILYPRESLV